MLRIKSLNFSYSQSRILKNISLEIPLGELWLVLGINGAGKTTFLKSISKQLDITPNTVFIDDKDICAYSPKEIASHISYLPQQTIFNANFSVIELLELTYKYRHGNKQKALYEEIMSFLNLTQLLEKNLHSLSGGEKQKVAFACALIQDSEYYCFDEPLNNLDPENISGFITIWEKLLLKKSKTLIIILHHWQNIFFSDLFTQANTLMLKEGEIFFMGKLSEAQPKLSQFYKTNLHKINYNNSYLYI